MIHARFLAVIATALLPLAAHATLKPGHLDPTFGVEGKRIVGASLPGGSQRGPAKLLEGPEGRLYLVGSVERSDATVAVAIARLSRDGAIDTTFGDGGLLEFVPEGVANAAAYGAVFDAQQRLIVVGESDLGGRHMLACRFDADGAVDLSFGTEATPGCIVQPLGEQDWANDVLVQPCPLPDECLDGKRLVVAGTRVLDGEKRGYVAAFAANGFGLDVSFAEEGIAAVDVDMTTSPNELIALARNASGALVAGGWREINAGDLDFTALRLLPDGSAEQGFGGDGFVFRAFDLGDPGFRRDAAMSVHLADDGVVLLAGHAQLDALSYRPALLRLRPDGTLDPTFDEGTGEAGKLTYQICGDVCDARFADVEVLPDGRIIAAGRIATGEIGDTDLAPNSNTLVMRIGPLGSPDADFGSPGSGEAGVSVIDHGAVLGNSDDVATSLLLQGEKIVVAGYARAEDPDPEDDTIDYYDFALARIGGGDPIFSDGFE